MAYLDPQTIAHAPLEENLGALSSKQSQAPGLEGL